MTAVTFCVVFVLAYLHYHLAGTSFLGASIYKLAFWVVLVSCATSLWLRRGTLEQWATIVLISVNMTLGWRAWGTADPILWHAVLHLAIAAIIIGFAHTRASVAVGALFLANVVLATLVKSGMFPDRPHVFTGFYYPDLIAYSGHAAMIITAGASGDVGKRVRDFLALRPVWFGVAIDRRDNCYRWLRRLAKVEAQ